MGKAVKMNQYQDQQGQETGTGYQPRYELKQDPAMPSEQLARRAGNANTKSLRMYRDGREVAEVYMGTADYMSSLGTITLKSEGDRLHLQFIDGACTGASVSMGGVRKRCSSVDGLLSDGLIENERMSEIVRTLQSGLLNKYEQCSWFLKDFFRLGKDKDGNAYKQSALSPQYVFA